MAPKKSFKFYDEGAPKVDEAALASGLEASKTCIRESIELQLQLVKEAGSKPKMTFDAQVDYSDEIMAAVTEVGTERLLDAVIDRREGQAQRRYRRGQRLHPWSS